MTPAVEIEADVLALFSLLQIPSDLRDAVVGEARRLFDASVTPQMPQIDRGAIEQRLKRLARLYADGLIDDTEYGREHDALTSLVHQVPSSPLSRFDPERAAARLADLPGRLRLRLRMNVGP